MAVRTGAGRCRDRRRDLSAGRLQRTLPYRPRKKGDRFERALSVTSVLESEWFRAAGLAIEHSDRASTTEDDFDACITALALLRRIVEDRPLVGSAVDSVAEGAMLLHFDQADFDASNIVELLDGIDGAWGHRAGTAAGTRR